MTLRRFTHLLFLGLFGLILLQSFDRAGDAKRRRDGTDPGYTGSPGDSFKNCTVCHGGTTTEVSGWIRSNIPDSGYVPGQVYSITATNYEIGATRFGFSISPQNQKGDLLGEMIITDTVMTKLIAGGKYITYRTGGVDGVDSLMWRFNWKAPADSVNTVVFYGAFNSNHDGHKEGDKTYLTQYWVFRQGYLTGLKNKAGGMAVKVYPNPAAGVLAVEVGGIYEADVLLTLYDMQGKKVLEEKRHTGSGMYPVIHTDISSLPAGVYTLRISGNGGVHTERVHVLR